MDGLRLAQLPPPMLAPSFPPCCIISHASTATLADSIPCTSQQQPSQSQRRHFIYHKANYLWAFPSTCTIKSGPILATEYYTGISSLQVRHLNVEFLKTYYQIYASINLQYQKMHEDLSTSALLCPVSTNVMRLNRLSQHETHVDLTRQLPSVMFSIHPQKINTKRRSTNNRSREYCSSIEYN